MKYSVLTGTPSSGGNNLDTNMQPPEAALQKAAFKMY
jgi:hypothetical protein